MKLKKLFRSLKQCKEDRKNWRINWRVAFEVDDDYYMFALLPTVGWQPWTFRRPNTSVIDIWWLNMHLVIGIWEVKSK